MLLVSNRYNFSISFHSANLWYTDRIYIIVHRQICRRVLRGSSSDATLRSRIPLLPVSVRDRGSKFRSVVFSTSARSHRLEGRDCELLANSKQQYLTFAPCNSPGRRVAFLSIKVSCRRWMLGCLFLGLKLENPLLSCARSRSAKY